MDSNQILPQDPIFPATERRISSMLTENRYSGNPEISFEKVPEIRPPRAPLHTHSRTQSSARTNSSVPHCQALTPVLNPSIHSDLEEVLQHRRNLSDLDSVLYEGTETEESEIRVTCREYSQHSRELKKSLPVLGVTPCSMYCKFCKAEVHTEILVSAVAFPGGFLSVLSSVFTCWSVCWLDGLKVHQCPNCHLVLAKSR